MRVEPLEPRDSPDELGILTKSSVMALIERLTSAIGCARRVARQLAPPGPAPARVASLANELHQLLSTSCAGLGAFDDLRIRWELVERRRLVEAEADFRQACESRGWRIDGVWPTLYVEYGLRVQFDERRDAVSVGDRRLCPISVGAAVAELAPMVATLPDPSDDTFGVALAKAYDEVADAGKPAPILDVYRELVNRLQPAAFPQDARSKGLRGLAAAQFRARLTAFLVSGGVAADGRHLRLLPPLSERTAMLVYQPIECRFGYVGRIAFETVR